MYCIASRHLLCQCMFIAMQYDTRIDHSHVPLHSVLVSERQNIAENWIFSCVANLTQTQRMVQHCIVIQSLGLCQHVH